MTQTKEERINKLRWNIQWWKDCMQSNLRVANNENCNHVMAYSLRKANEEYETQVQDANLELNRLTQ